MPTNRLYFVTGKGGVGKTSAAIAITNALNQQGKKAKYNSFDHFSADDTVFLRENHIPFFHLDTKKSMEEYISKKLSSKTIAKWIVKTPFFISLINMMPGLSSMILFGHLLDALEHDPELIIVLDSPSSGHALTMLESPFNFKEMFKNGAIVGDIDRMISLLRKENFFKSIIVSLPTEMAIEESLELKKSLDEFSFSKTSIIINDLLSESKEILSAKSFELPPFLKKKVEIEKKIIAINSQSIDFSIPHITLEKRADFINQLAKVWGKNLK